jgi:hypothetical protein
MSTTQIENILRRAPQPAPPGILRQQLQAQALRAPRPAAPSAPALRAPGSWFARWWPALAPAAVSLACAAVFTVQQAEIQKLKRSTVIPDPSQSLQQGSSAPSSARSREVPDAGAMPEPEELARLRVLAAGLRSEVTALEQMRAENDKLRGQLAARMSGVLSLEETQALERAREKAMSIQCVNNLKQLGLAVKVWSLDSGNLTPPNVLSMSNEMGSFKILICPADTSRQAAKNPASFTAANSSYEYLAPSAPDTEPNRILFRCPIHGSICLMDGSVQMEAAKQHPEQIVQQDGKLYFGSPPDAAALPPAAPGSNP